MILARVYILELRDVHHENIVNTPPGISPFCKRERRGDDEEKFLSM